MEPMLTVLTAAVLLAIAALGGTALAAIRFAGTQQPPARLAMIHGLLAAAAITLLIYACFTKGLPLAASAALVLFLIAAAGGAYLNLNFHWKQVLPPKGLIVGHPLGAIVAFVLLLVALFG